MKKYFYIIGVLELIAVGIIDIVYLVYFFINFGIGKSIQVSFLYSEKPSFLDCRLSAIGMLTKRNKSVLAIAPISKYHFSVIEKTQRPIPHHIKISPR